MSGGGTLARVKGCISERTPFTLGPDLSNLAIATLADLRPPEAEDVDHQQDRQEPGNGLLEDFAHCVHERPAGWRVCDGQKTAENRTTQFPRVTTRGVLVPRGTIGPTLLGIVGIDPSSCWMSASERARL